VSRRVPAVFASCLFALSPIAGAADLNVVSWDGAYVKSQILGFIRDYEAERDVDIDVLQYDGGTEEIRSQVRSWNVTWDVVDMEMNDAVRACNEGLLERLDPGMLPPAPDGVPAEQDFVKGSLMPCGIGNIVGATVIAWDAARGRGPERLEDFFDLRGFPGKRGLRRSPAVNLEWALIADGVAPDRLYEVLATPAGQKRAFDVLDRIRPAVEWWRSGEEAIRLLESGRVVMTSVYNGRVHDAVQRGRRFEILWDHQVWLFDVWAIPAHGTRGDLARDFIRYATSTRSLARQMQYIPYGPARRSALPLIDPAIRTQLPTAEDNMASAIEGNAQFWAQHIDELGERFERWLERDVMVPKDLPR
jgi:putative spermidine/putrescine transport system substrate-binding protein